LNTLRIAFVANNKQSSRFMGDPAFIYRCENLALALRQAGHQVELLHVSQLRAHAAFDIVVLHRPRKHWLTALRLAWLRRGGCRIIADFDDLVFLPQWAHVSPGVVNGLVSLAQTEKNFAEHAAALGYCDAFMVSVLPLQQKLQAFGKPVLLLPNAVHMSWYNEQEDAARLSRPTLTYFPGTRSHDRDFATIQPILEQLLTEEPELCLQITGELNTQIHCRPNQLLRFAKQPFAGYARHVAKSWVNLAPLEDSEFNRHKSALKAIEAAWFNAPTLASPIPDMQRLEKAGAMLMQQSDDWYRTIKALLSDNYYAEVSQQLRQRMMQQGCAEQHAAQFLQFALL
jgi:hypothetical protein